MQYINKLSLKSLQILATVAKYQSATKAAQELHLSPSALSHQLKRLEQAIGRPLFRKQGRRQLLLPEIKRWADDLQFGFEHINTATGKLLGSENTVINLGVLSAFAVNRLTPELGLWQNSHSHIDVRIRMLNCEDDIESLHLDACLGNKVESQYYDNFLLSAEQYYPVCSKEYLLAAEQQDFSQLILQGPLLELTDVGSWNSWFDYFQINADNKLQYIRFSHTILILQAVLAHQGIALLERSMIKNQLDSGALVLLHEHPMQLPELGYHFAIHQSRKYDKNMPLLKNWLEQLLQVD